MPPRPTGDGPFADRLTSTLQALAMTSWSNPEQQAIAAGFTRFLHTPEPIAASCEATRVPPADDRFYPDTITVPPVCDVFDRATENPAPRIENYVPFGVWLNGFNTAQVRLISGQMESSEAAAAFTPDVADTWPQANRPLLQRYKQRAAEKVAAGA